MTNAAHLEVGTVFAERFRVVRQLGEGGMGAVYEVEQFSTAKHRALKVMHPQFAADQRSVARFEQEARVGAQIDSEHVVEVVDAGVDAATGTPWIAMELLRGEELGDRVARRGAVDPRETLEILTQLCHALGAAHRAGLVHRDLKPENIYLAAARREGGGFTVKILDFGIAKWVQESQSVQATMSMGSPLWMAPEQADGQSRISPATDVWALGLLAFHLLTGRVYWTTAHSSDPSLGPLLMELLQAPLAPASERAAALGCPPGAIPPGFDAWFARCVVRDPAARFAHADEAYAALARVLAPYATPSGAAAVASGASGARVPAATPSPWIGAGATPPPGYTSAPASAQTGGVALAQTVHTPQAPVPANGPFVPAPATPAFAQHASAPTVTTPGGASAPSRGQLIAVGLIVGLIVTALAIAGAFALFGGGGNGDGGTLAPGEQPQPEGRAALRFEFADEECRRSFPNAPTAWSIAPASASANAAAAAARAAGCQGGTARNGTEIWCCP